MAETLVEFPVRERTFDKAAYDRQYNEESRQRRRVLANEFVGDHCLFCGYRERLVIHRKDGVPHKDFHLMGYKEFAEHMCSNNYARVCFHCHKGVHWAMKHLGLSWDEIGAMM